MKKFLGIILILCLVFAQFSYGKEKEKVDEVSVMDVINYEWWLGFGDPHLSRHIFNAVRNNSDLRIAKLKLEEYRQFTKASFGAELPSVSMTLGGYAMNSSPLPAHLMRKDGLVMPITLSYELDLYGKNRNKTQSTKKQMEAYQYELQTVYLSLAADVSTVYFNVAQINETIGLQNRLLLIKENVLGNKRQKFANGLISDMELNSALQDVESIRSEIGKLKKNRITLLTQLSMLLGEDPNNFENIQISRLSDINRSDIRFTISSDTIFSRSDVLAYEKQMEKAKIDIKVARKEFLPTISLNGGVFFSNMAGGGFFSKDNTIWNLLGGVSGDLFSGGRKKANLNIMKSRYEQIFEDYRKVTMRSVKEVNDSVYGIRYNGDISKNATQKYILERRNYQHHRNMLNNGLITKTDLQEAEQKLINAKIELASVKTEQYVGYVSLYKATGGKI